MTGYGRIYTGSGLDMAKEKNTDKKEGSEKKEKVYKVLDILIPVVCISVFVFSGFNLFRIYRSYAEADAIYNGLALMATHSAGTQEEQVAVAMEEAGFPYLNVDHEGLLKINPDYKGWLYFPLLDISYPVVYGDEAQSYLNKTFDGTPSKSGAIYIDAWSNPDLKDMTTLIYGHNMRNGSMFGSLKRIRNEEGLVDQDPYFYYYTPTIAYKCHIFVYYLENANGMTYKYPTDNRTYDQYMDYILEKNEYADGPNNVDVAHRPRILSLSTCSGFHSGRRTVIHAAIEDSYKIGDNLIVDDSFGDAVETDITQR